MRLGILSDTHGYLDPRVFDIFAGVDRILHAGDIGFPSLILELEGVAPVTAVVGNTDPGLDFPVTAVVEAAGWKIMVHHIVDPAEPQRSIGERFRRSRPGLVVFGHTHKAWNETRDGVVFLNPGYAGKPRFHLPRSVVVAELKPGKQPEFRFVSL